GFAALLRRVIGEDIELVSGGASEPDYVEVDPGQIEQVLMNLAINARDAMPGGGRLTLEVQCLDLVAPLTESQVSLPPGRYAVLSVADTGHGMDQETLQRIFEPFFTTKEMGKGTGLGLATVYGVVKQSHGEITVSSALGRGTTFRVYLPRVDPPSVANRPEAAGETRSVAGAESILLVEDELAVRVLAREALREHGYRVQEASHGAEALRLWQDAREPIDLLITDLVMPGMSGRELAE